MRRGLAAALALASASRASAARPSLAAAVAVVAARRRFASAGVSAAAAAAAVEPADAFSVEMLTSASQWRVAATDDDGCGASGAPASRLRKAFELADARTATRFEAQLRDLNLRLARRGLEPLHLAARAAPTGAASGSGGAVVAIVDVRVARPAGAAPRVLTQREVDAAMAADSVAAELQLAGKWS
jgi:hypothetical protein